MSDPEPIDFDFGETASGGPAPGSAAGASSTGADPLAAGDGQIPLDPAGEPVPPPPPHAADPHHAHAAAAPRTDDPLHAHAAAARASAADAAFAVSSYPYAPAAIERAKPAWTHGATPQPWSRERRLTMGILLAVLAVVAAAVIALSIRAIDVFLRGG